MLLQSCVLIHMLRMQDTAQVIDVKGWPSLMQERRLEHAEIHGMRMKKERDAAGEALQQHQASAQASAQATQEQLNQAAEACRQLEVDLHGHNQRVQALQQAKEDLKAESLMLRSQCMEKDQK